LLLIKNLKNVLTEIEVENIQELHLPLGKLHFTPLMYPHIGDLTPNVQKLIDDPHDVKNTCQSRPSVHLLVTLDEKEVTCITRDLLSK
jgi:hypothetical protein